MQLRRVSEVAETKQNALPIRGIRRTGNHDGAFHGDRLGHDGRSTDCLKMW